MTSRWQLSVAEQPAGDGPGEDRWLFYEAPDGTTWAAVIDGASGSREAPTGGDYADALCEALVAAADSAPSATPQEALRDAITRTAQRLSLPRPSQPSAAVGLVRMGADNIKACVLGDVTVVTLRGRSETALRDDRLGRVGGELRLRYKELLRAGHGYGPRHQEILNDLRAAELMARNQPGGYWIAADHATAADRALTDRVAPPPDTIVLASDGAVAAMNRYQLLRDWRAFASAVRLDPSGFVRQIRTAEESDLNGLRWPRSKPHDDVAALVISRRDAT
ncbi:PP2C family serine/threonine-protein phosphatase [Oryzihumus leptocrescens]|uniref:Protein phosphatase 2C-like protein n=1 Tax=Oryzihumus leptocrescens TaxID=297536 RepID=A0A542ZER5_9MICO|nr:PP2C family serine/threonine-protein phosphatase [Oryzihumus leptocrescens]TQL58779.1 protein phosphatase 2C-like protein [Oryzihumus leptocrescens]